MTAPTIALAIASVVAHCLAIFWPRKPLKTPVDENGFPILWCNNNQLQQDITCVWRSAAEQPSRDLATSARERQSA